MYRESSGKQQRMELVTLEELVPQDHLLRKIERAIDFSFINKICKESTTDPDSGYMPNSASLLPLSRI